MLELPAEVRHVPVRRQLQNDDQLRALEEGVQVLDDGRVLESLEHVHLRVADLPCLGVHLEDLYPLQRHLRIALCFPERAVHLRELPPAERADDLEVLDARHDPATSVVQDLLRRGPLRRVDIQDAAHKVNELLGPCLRWQRRVSRGAYGITQRLEVHVCPVEGRVARSQLIEGAAKAPDIRREGVAFAPHDLRAHVEGRAHTGEGALRDCGHGLRQPKVSEFCLPVFPQEDVRGLHVAVQDPPPVQVSQRTRHVVDPAPKKALVGARARDPGALDPLRQGAAGGQLHDEVEVAVVGEVSVVLDQMGMVQHLEH
mmetsp:Transcript_62181/g.181528  ORF Transcript_62181/g.181528 Transcript_62181/m.181528 type:complete len:314 (+) Transcript_62181:708-1649(+)